MLNKVPRERTEPVGGSAPRRTERLPAFPRRLSLLLAALFATLTLLAAELD
jgi:hypothetical protein